MASAWRKLKFLAFLSRVLLVFWLNFDSSAFCYCKKQIDVSFSCVWPVVIDNEFRHNIVKVVCGSTRLSRRGPTATLTMLWRNSWSDRRMKNWHQFVNCNSRLKNLLLKRVHAGLFTLACTHFNEQNKGPNLLRIITWFVLGKQNVLAKKVY